MALRFAIRQGWLAGLGSEDELMEAMRYETDGERKKYSLTIKAEASTDWHPGASLSIVTSQMADEISTEMTFFSDLVSSVGKQLYMHAALYLSPVYMGPRSARSFELALNAAIFRFVTDDGVSFEFIFAEDDLVVSRNRGGNGKREKTEELYSGEKWSRGGKQKLAQYFDPRIVEAPRIFWLKLLGKVFDGQLLGETVREASALMCDELIGQTALIKVILGIG